MRRKITSHVNIWVPSMVKWTKKMLQFTKTIIFLVKGLKVVAKRCLNWISLRANLCYCVWILKCRKSSWDLKYSSLKVMLKSKWFEYSFRHRFHDLNYFEVGIFFHIPWIRYLLEGIMTRFCGNPIIPMFFILLWTNFRQSLVRYHLLCTTSFEICRIFLDLFYYYNLIGFVDEYDFEICMSFFFTNSKLVYSFESLSLNTT